MIGIKRKVIKLAEKTLVVSLPAYWTKANNISKGDELFLEDQQSKIMISKSSPDVKSSVSIDGDSLGVLTKRVLNELYHSGTDRVIMKIRKPETLERLNIALNQLLGYHIIEQKGNSVVIEDLAKSDQDFQVILRRFMLLLKTMLDDSVQSVKKNDFNLSSIAARDIDINKFAHLCMRALNKGKFPTNEIARLHTMIYQIEQMGDDIKNVITEVEKRPEITNSIEKALNAATNLYGAAYEYFFSRTLANALEVAAANDKAKISVKSIQSDEDNIYAITRLNAFIKKAVSIQELFLHDLQDVRHDEG